MLGYYLMDTLDMSWLEMLGLNARCDSIIGFYYPPEVRRGRYLE